MAAAIDKYVYLTLNRNFSDDFILKYSQLERVKESDEIRHPIVREAFKMLDLSPKHLEVCSMADIPAGTGLGSSGSFSTALLRALHCHLKSFISPRELAEQACEIELGRLKEPIGKQDQYIAACGGLCSFSFEKDGSVKVESLQIPQEAYDNLEDNLLLFFTGFSRSASSILKDQDDRSKKKDQSVIDNLHYIKDLGLRSKKALEAGALETFGRLMHEHWEQKRRRSSGISNPQVDAWYERGMKNGALGGKLVGAGGGGFLLFYAADKTTLRHAMREAGLEEVRFRFEPSGSEVLIQ